MRFKASRRQMIRAAFVPLMVAVLLALGTLAWNRYFGARNFYQRYRNATNACGKNPVVIVEKFPADGPKYTIVEPGKPQYNSAKTYHYFSRHNAVLFVCSTPQAQSMLRAQGILSEDIDSTSNVEILN